MIDIAAFQLGLWCHHVHPPGRLPAVLASQANDNAAQHHGGEVQLHVPRMVGYFRWVARNFFLNASLTSNFVLLEDPKDLIRKCLVVDPEKRITVRECLKHPFFNTVVSSSSCAGSERASAAQTRLLFSPPTRFPEHFTQTIFRLIKLLVLWQPPKPHEKQFPPLNCLLSEFLICSVFHPRDKLFERLKWLTTFFKVGKIWQNSSEIYFSFKF